MHVKFRSYVERLNADAAAAKAAYSSRFAQLHQRILAVFNVVAVEA